MITAAEIIKKYIAFFEKRGHKRIANAPLVPENDPTTLFTSSGMQPLIPYLLGQKHPLGKRLVNVQNCFRAQDIDEVGDNRHVMFFRMLGNWSLGDYFKAEQLPWFFEFLTKELEISPKRLFVSVFKGDKKIPKDNESAAIWEEIFKSAGFDPKDRIFYYDFAKNWWSRTGEPDNMPVNEPGGPDSEVFFEFANVEHDTKYGENCHPNCNCGRFMEIGNSVFMQYQKQEDGGFGELPQKNIDFGGGLERILSAIEDKQDIFTTNLFYPIVASIEKTTGKLYQEHKSQIRIVVDHLVGAVFMVSADVAPSNKEQGYILRRLIRRSFDNLNLIGDKDVSLLIKTVLEQIVSQYKDTDAQLETDFEKITNTILEEIDSYKVTLKKGSAFIRTKYKTGDELKGVVKISSQDAFLLYSSYGLSPAQIEGLGLVFDRKEFAQKMEKHQNLSRAGAEKKFKGGLADSSRETIMGHTVTHLLHQALRDVLGNSVFQAGSNITSERVRFDFSFARKMTDEELARVEEIVNQKIEDNLPVTSRIISAGQARKIGAIGLFKQKYQDSVKVYFVGGIREDLADAYSREFCGGPHVDFTGELKRFKIIKEEGLGQGKRRIYCKVAF